MTFKITISRPPMEIEFKTGSVSEAVSILQQENTELNRAFQEGTALLDRAIEAAAAAETQEAPATATELATAAAEPKKERKKRGADPAAAVAPAPLPVPSSPASPPAPPTATQTPTAVTTLAPPNLAEGANGIPAYLDRNLQGGTAGAAPPPPPLLPAAPPVAPAPPVSGPVGQKIIAELEKRAAGSPDSGKSLADWLALPTVGLTVPGATFVEAIDCLRMIGDAKLGGVATALGV